MPATLYDELEEAKANYARENGDGFGRYDWLGAQDYIGEGFEIGFEASQIVDDEDRQAFIENEADAFGETACGLVCAAARYRVSEIHAALKVAA